MADPDEFRFSFVNGDNEVTLSAGANLIGDEYLGNIEVKVASTDAEGGVTTYAPDLPIDVGNATISVTCP